MLKNTLIIIFVLAMGYIDVTAQGGPKPNAKVFKISTEYEPNHAYPFGRLNPKAPPETKQFSFMIGEFDCDDRIMNPANGKWFEYKAIRRAAYILNGYAIHDQNWTPLLNSTNIRSFNPKTKLWEVTYFKYPGYYTGVWKGKMEGENMVVRQGKGAKESRLSFFNIGRDAYSWMAERMVDGKPKMNWEFTCRRRR